MRILQVVTLVTPDGAYGGPVRVAVNQARGLTERGHEVTLVAGSYGFDVPPTELEGVAVALFPARRILPKTGFAGLASPALIRWLRRNLDSYDVVHVHLARDLISLPAARLALARARPVVVQTHGMIDPSSRLMAGPLDAVLTKAVLTRSSSVLYLTERERRDLELVAGPGARLKLLHNGVPPTGLSADPSSQEVLFLARLQARKNPMAFVSAAAHLHPSFPGVRFTLVGPDEGEGQAVTAAIERAQASSYIIWEGALAPSDTLARMSAASVYVLPSFDEPYPMSVLEAMSVGLPVVVTDTCGLAPAVERLDAGIVTDGTTAALTTALAKMLSAPDLRRTMGANARSAASAEFGMESVIQQLIEFYGGLP